MTAIVKRKVGKFSMAEGRIVPFSEFDPLKGLQLGFYVIQDQPPNKSMTVILDRESACELVQAWVKMEQENDQLLVTAV